MIALPTMRKVFFPLALAILLIAALLRLWQLHTYPPGPHYDEAVEMLITRSIAFNGASFFPIVNSYQGREVLFYYLSVPLFQFVYDDVLSLRAANVFCNLMAIAASMALGRAMFKGNRGVIIGLAVGVLMTLSFPQIWLSRQAFRTGPLPMLQALSLLFLWRGLKAQRHSVLLLIVGGFFGGAALYTYMASRLFPLWLLLGGLMILWFDKGNRGNRLRQGVLFFSALGIAAIPIAVYALQNPDIFFRRLAEVTTTGEIVSLEESIRRHLLMFFVEGEAYLRYNIPGRPYLTWLEGLLMLAGLGVCVWRLLRKGVPSERAAFGLVLLSPLMVIPSVISVGGLPPNHMRSVGMVPLIFMLVAVGFEAIFKVITHQLSAINSRHLALLSSSSLLTVSIVVPLFIGGFLVGQTYFEWASRNDLFYESDADLALAARWFSTQVDDNTLVYVGSRHVEHPTVIAGWNGKVTWLGQNTLFLPPTGKTALVVFAHLDPPAPAWAAWLAPYQVSDVPVIRDSDPAFYAYRVPADAQLPASIVSLNRPIGNGFMTLVGVASTPIVAGESGEIETAWRIEQPIPYSDLTPIIQLEDTAGTVISRSSSYIVFSDQWQPGSILMLRTKVEVPIGTPPGQYHLRLTWGSVVHDTYLSFVTDDGAQTGIWIDLSRLTINRPMSFPDASSLPITHHQAVEVAPGVRLLGWNPPQTNVRPGETLALKLFWQAIPDDARPSVALQASLEALNGDRALIYEGEVVVGYPSKNWIDGELITAPMYWNIPREQPSGDYKLLMEVDDISVEVGTLNVDGLPRLFDAPPVQAVLNAQFGDSLNLYGYNLNITDSILLELIWQSLAEVDTDYTVFVHLMAQDGTIVMQHDLMPQNNIYPTSLWVAGEYVRDEYRFSNVSPGRYRLRVGFYLKANGQRLPLVSTETVTDFVEISPVEFGLESRSN